MNKERKRLTEKDYLAPIWSRSRDDKEQGIPYYNQFI